MAVAPQGWGYLGGFCTKRRSPTGRIPANVRCASVLVVRREKWPEHALFDALTFIERKREISPVDCDKACAPAATVQKEVSLRCKSPNSYFAD
jgi:hypothetical protein